MIAPTLPHTPGDLYCALGNLEQALGKCSLAMASLGGDEKAFAAIHRARLEIGDAIARTGALAAEGSAAIEVAREAESAEHVLSCFHCRAPIHRDVLIEDGVFVVDNTGHTVTEFRARCSACGKTSAFAQGNLPSASAVEQAR